jgi:phosphoglycolate phosphatase-like HAD superfamily hydrolase
VNGALLYLFDIDGTLLLAHGSGKAAFDAVFHATHGIADGSAGIRYGGKTDPAIIDELYNARLGRSATTEEHAAFLADYLPRLQLMLDAQGVAVLAGVVEALAFLQTQPDVILGIGTGNVVEGAAKKLEAANLHAYFVLGGYGSDSRVRGELVGKGIERGRALAGERGIREVIVVGDTIHDISAARACGATVCAVATGSDTADALSHADVVFATLHELPAWHKARFGSCNL